MPEETKPDVTKKDVDDLRNLIAELAKGHKTVVDSVKSIGEGLTDLSMRVAGGGGDGAQPPTRGESGGSDSPEVDLERLSNTELVRFMSGAMETAFKKYAEGIDKKLTTFNNDTIVRDLKEQTKMAKEQHKDFDHWTDDMKTLFTSNPYLTIEQAYQIARGTNSTKAKEIDDKLKLESKEGDTSLKELTPKIRFGGLTPTSGGNKDGGTQYKTQSEAAEAAWDEVMSDVAIGEDQVI